MPGIRAATADDAEPIARLFRLVRTQCLPFLPVQHTPAQDAWFFHHIVLRDCTVEVIEAPLLAGFCAWRPGWVEHLYVHPAQQGCGLGTALLARPMAENTSLRLWMFLRNTPALHFYAARGFREVERTAGSRNDEREPDALLEWVQTAQGTFSTRRKCENRRAHEGSKPPRGCTPDTR